MAMTIIWRYRLNRTELYEKLIYSNGQEHQLTVAIEEMSELTKEIVKMLRIKGNRMHLIEEIADVEICLEQLKLIYSVDNKEIELFKKFKLSRLQHYYIGEKNEDK